MLKPIFTTAQVRAIEQAAGQVSPPLMECAGLAAAEHARRIMGGQARRILIVAGPGNNGGDAFEVAAHLKRWFYRVTVVFAGERGRLSADAASALSKWEAAGGVTEQSIPADGRWDLVVDGLFGIGLQRPLAGPYAELVRAMNALGAPILALDIPSGLNADTGAIMGTAIRAADTITFIGLKPGLLTLDGPDCVGRLHTDPIGLETQSTLAPQGRLLDGSALSGLLPRRPQNFHKGMAGNVAVLGGDAGMVGAALLAGRAALRSGAGRVYLGLLGEEPLQVDVGQPELMLRSGEQVLEASETNVIAAGPGMGRSDQAVRLLRRALGLPVTLVLDADALNVLAGDSALAETLRARSAPALLTPHPAEAARLLGCSTREVQSDRIAAAKGIAERYQASVALKGNGTVIARSDGSWWINSSGNAGMASAGMGDALTGFIAGLAAQGADPLAALLAGVWLHGAAADAAAGHNGGPLGLTASDVIDRARPILNSALYPSS